jgi:hypothetical protein
MNSSLIAFHAGMACGFLVDTYCTNITNVTWDPVIGTVFTVAAGVGILVGVYQLVTEGRKEVAQ